ncbi:hypothetical protein M1K46_14410 [Fictibacillus sp. WQ 8-8]|nr:hypothetical protein [Fictibacillus sp. WQ 8-8]MCQ6266846.1 hypothetical protein [Fictibacillus sp. WQ 8-8]
MNCASCHGNGEETCLECNGSGMHQNGNCPDCMGEGVSAASAVMETESLTEQEVNTWIIR